MNVFKHGVTTLSFKEMGQFIPWATIYDSIYFLLLLLDTIKPFSLPVYHCILIYSSLVRSESEKLFFFFLPLLGPLSQHIEVPRLRVESEL